MIKNDKQKRHKAMKNDAILTAWNKLTLLIHLKFNSIPSAQCCVWFQLVVDIIIVHVVLTSRMKQVGDAAGKRRQRFRRGGWRPLDCATFTGTYSIAFDGACGGLLFDNLVIFKVTCIVSLLWCDE